MKIHIYKDPEETGRHYPRVDLEFLCGGSGNKHSIHNTWLEPLLIHKAEVLCEKCVDLLPPLVLLSGTEL